jgi:hypothetical protein
MMLLLLKRWRLLVALVAALAVTVTTATQAFAAEPGEGSSWSDESVGGNGSPLQSYATYSEARGGQTGALVQIWRGLDNHVWLAVNNGPVFAAGGGNNTTTTYAAPVVVYSNGWFYAFQTGTDNNVYWSRAFDGIIGSNTPSASESYNWSNWTAIGESILTQGAVSVAPVPGDGLLMTWQGVNQTAMYSAWLQVGTDVFNPPQQIPASSSSPPSVTYDPVTHNFALAFRGLLDNQVYVMAQVLGQNTWTVPEQLTGITTPVSPTIAADGQGDILVGAVDYSGYIWFQAVNNSGTTTGWSEESAREYSPYIPIWISVIANVFYVVATQANNYVQWKQAWNGNKGI